MKQEEQSQQHEMQEKCFQQEVERKKCVEKQDFSIQNKQDEKKQDLYLASTRFLNLPEGSDIDDIWSEEAHSFYPQSVTIPLHTQQLDSKL